jgi:hypothetical protein
MQRPLAVLAVTALTTLAACPPSGNGDTFWLATPDQGSTLYLVQNEPFPY